MNTTKEVPRLRDEGSLLTEPPRVAETIESLECLPNYLIGLRFYAISSAFCLNLFLVSLEVTVVATSLLSIADEFNSFSRSSWIVTAYMLTYTGLLIISVKLSDIFGRKPCLIVFLLIFTVFSGACGAAQDMTQLIVLRAMQGIGAAGGQAITVAMFFELVPPSKYANTGSVGLLVFAISYAAGPLIGGAVTAHASWRWIFLINIPVGVIAIVVITLAVPQGFPYHGLTDSLDHRFRPNRRNLSTKLQKLDYIGAFALLLASILIVTTLQEATTAFSWQSAPVITMLVVSALAWLAFITWSWQATKLDKIEPVFPWRFVQSRRCLAILIITLVSGAPLTISIITLPLRFQYVERLSALQAGIRSLPFTTLMPVGMSIGSTFMSRAKIPPLYLSVTGSVIQIIGYALMSNLSQTRQVGSSFYACEAIAGLGVGLALAAVVIAMPFTVEPRDKAVANGAVVQFRLLGGVIGLAIVTAVFDKIVKSRLTQYLDADEISKLLESSAALKELPVYVIGRTKATLTAAYDIQLRIVIGFAGAQIPAALLLWGNPQLKV